jgi:hypothetical protein
MDQRPHHRMAFYIREHGKPLNIADEPPHRQIHIPHIIYITHNAYFAIYSPEQSTGKPNRKVEAAAPPSG